MKMLSTILYKEEAVWAMIAGRAYCFSSFPMFSVPSSVGMDEFDAILCYSAGLSTISISKISGAYDGMLAPEPL